MKRESLELFPGRFHVVLIALLLAAIPSFATTVKNLDLPELVKSADTIIQGRVDSIEYKWEENLAYTYVSITVDDPMKGERRRSVLIRQVGGKIGSLNVTVAGMPTFKTGDEVIVFLRTQRNGTFAVTGLNQGKYDVVDGFAVSNVSGLTVVDSKTGQFADPGSAPKTPLESFKAKIKELVR